MKYVYPAVFYKDKKLPETYSVIFPDVEGAATCGYSLFDAVKMAEEALSEMLIDWEDSKAKGEEFFNQITEPTPIEKVVAVPDEFSSKAFVTLIKADTDSYRKNLSSENNTEDDEEDLDAGKKILVPKYDDDKEMPETLAREICRVAGLEYPFEADAE